jgi:hypothetical protein
MGGLAPLRWIDAGLLIRAKCASITTRIKLMHASEDSSCVAFHGHEQIASGALAHVALAVKQALDAGAAGPVLIFDDHSSRQIEIDFRGTPDEVLARLQLVAPAPAESANRGPGRPKLGVVAREVTLLPRHWEWLSGQPGGASAVLRKLVDEARRAGNGRDRARLAGESVDRFMLALAGDLPGYEEASRAFWRKQHASFIQWTDAWPADVREHVRRLAATTWDTATTA